MGGGIAVYSPYNVVSHCERYRGVRAQRAPNFPNFPLIHRYRMLSIIFENVFGCLGANIRRMKTAALTRHGSVGPPREEEKGHLPVESSSRYHRT